MRLTGASTMLLALWAALSSAAPAAFCAFHGLSSGRARPSGLFLFTAEAIALLAVMILPPMIARSVRPFISNERSRTSLAFSIIIFTGLFASLSIPTLMISCTISCTTRSHFALLLIPRPEETLGAIAIMTSCFALAASGAFAVVIGSGKAMSWYMLGAFGLCFGLPLLEYLSAEVGDGAIGHWPTISPINIVPTNWLLQASIIAAVSIAVFAIFSIAKRHKIEKSA